MEKKPIFPWSPKVSPTPANESATAPAGSLKERIAIALWHQFAPENHMEWDEETHRAEYILAAESALLFMRPHIEDARNGLKDVLCLFDDEGNLDCTFEELQRAVLGGYDVLSHTKPSYEITSLPGADSKAEQEATASPAKEPNREFDSPDRGHTFAVAQSSQVSDGYVLMPREATRAMTMAACDYLPSCEHVFGFAGEMLRKCYAKMVEVAAQPPAAPVEAISLAEPPSALTADDRAQDLAHSRSSAGKASAPFHFDRYVNGTRMAEDVEISNASTAEEAFAKARALYGNPRGMDLVLTLNEPQEAPDGFVLVPREPSNEILKAGCVALDKPAAKEEMLAAMVAPGQKGIAIARTKMRLRWKAMIEAASPLTRPELGSGE